MNEKQRTAMQQALEALEKCNAALAEELAARDIDPPLRHVLEASNSCGPSIAAIRAALAEPEREPVAHKMSDLPMSGGVKRELENVVPYREAK